MREAFSQDPARTQPDRPVGGYQEEAVDGRPGLARPTLPKEGTAMKRRTPWALLVSSAFLAALLGGATVSRAADDDESTYDKAKDSASSGYEKSKEGAKNAYESTKDATKSGAEKTKEGAKSAWEK